MVATADTTVLYGMEAVFSCVVTTGNTALQAGDMTVSWTKGADALDASLVVGSEIFTSKLGYTCPREVDKMPDLSFTCKSCPITYITMSCFI